MKRVLFILVTAINCIAFITRAENVLVESINTNFNDGTWGIPADANPSSGAYPSSEVNGFKLVKAVLRSGSIVCTGGDKHTNRIYFKNKIG